MKTFGIILSFTGILIGMQLGSNISAFVDIPAMLFVTLIGFGILVASHGTHEVVAAIFKFGDRPSESNESQIAETGITAFVAAGWIGTLVGVVQLLSALEDPAQLGLGTAIALMSALYGYIAAYAICFPISRRQRLA